MRFRSLLALTLGFFAAPLLAQRQTLPLLQEWKFIRRDVGVTANLDEKWQSVSLPHAWNIQDLPPGAPEGKYRGAGWYQRTLVLPPEAKGRRVFARFEAAATVSDVYVGNLHVGQHRGSFGAFCYELTPLLQGPDPQVLRVRVDNSPFQDVAPLEGDFTMHGGLYRPAALIITDPVCISPMDHASSGVYLTVKGLSNAEAIVDVKALVSSALPGAAEVKVQVEIQDAAGRVVATRESALALAGGETKPLSQELRIAQPHRWQGRKDPYLYTASVHLVREGRRVDTVTQSLGLRTIAITDRGVVLNGEPTDVYGVNRHQDLLGKGWALSPADHEADVRTILDMGCTGLRLAHYQQSGQVHDLCDRGGLIVWQEIPLVNRISGLPQFGENAKQQLTEMILQGYNHPSLCFWGLFNELNASWTGPLGPAPDRLIAELRRLAQELDATRPTVAASFMREASPLHEVPQEIAFNIYPGWYWGQPEDFSKTVLDSSGFLGGKRVGISEYGAGASVFQHQEGELAPPKNTTSHFHPEEWQAIVHERIWSQARHNPRLWGTFLWALFDFSSEGRDEGDAPGRNDKGLITMDRKVRKDAFYFYQANWAQAPMVHIAASRMTPRKLASTEVKVYSNCPQVELRLNGKSLGVAKADDVHIFRWSQVQLAPGQNRVEAIGKRDGEALRDECTWVLEAKP